MSGFRPGLRRVAATLLVLLVEVPVSAPAAFAAGTQSPTDAAAQARAIFDKADGAASEHKFREALPLAEEALGFFEKAYGPEHRQLVSPLVLVGDLRRIAGDLRGAEAAYLRALAIAECELGEYNADTAMVLNNLAVIYRLLGEYAKAVPLYERAIAIRERVLDSESEITAESRMNLAIVLAAVGDYATAEAHLVRTIAIYERVFAQDQHTGKAYGAYASLLHNRGDYVTAERLHNRALAIHERTLGPEHPTTLISLNNLAFHHLRMGAYGKAEPLLARALATREKVLGPEHPELITSLDHLATLFVLTGQTARARPLFERALRIGRTVYGPDSEHVAITHAYLAQLELAEGAVGAARANLETAVALFEKALGRDHPRSATTRATLGALHVSQGDLASARPYLESALAVRERVLGDDHPMTASSLADWATYLWASGRLDEAVAAQARANDARERDLVRNLAGGSEQRKLLYLDLSAREFDRTLSLHTRGAPANAAAARAALEIILRRKGRALDVMTRQIEALRKRAAPEDRTLLSDLSIARAELARQTLAGVASDVKPEYRAERERLARKVEDLETRAAERGADIRAGALSIALDDVRAAIAQDACLIEIASYEPFDPKTNRYDPARYVAYLLDAEGRIQWKDLGPIREIDALVRQFRSQLNSRTTEGDAREAARALDERVMMPLRRLLDPKIGRLLVSPDGALNLVPFAAFVDEHGGYLVESFDIVYLTSGRDLVRLKASPSSEKRRPAAVVANPDFGVARSNAGAPRLRFPPLPGTDAEARAIAGLLSGSKLLTGAAATEAALKRMSGPEILHVATHGFFLDSGEPPGESRQADASWEVTREIVQATGSTTYAQGPVGRGAADPLLRSGLGLAGANRYDGGKGDDGLLTALETAGLDLWGTRLVVLSACDTGVGEVRAGDGVYGLRRVLVLAGAEAQLSSLWAVSDRATRELMVSYYRELLAGRGRSEALRRTQLTLLTDARRRHPYYWAGFIPTGAWWPIVPPRQSVP